jgi:glycosyltransferase involved in cell wall biosynthesis
MRVAMLLHKSVEHDSRVRRAARALSDSGHEVTVLHLPRVSGELDGPLDGFSVRSVTPPGWVRRRLPTALYRTVFLAAFVRAVRRLRPQAVHAHDAAMLLPGWLGARLSGAELVYDSHELAVGVPYRTRAWALLVRWMERVLIGRCAATITVSEGIADRLQGHYGLRDRPVVVRNLPDLRASDSELEAPDLRDALGLAPQTPLVLHLGAAAPHRGCVVLLRAMALLPDAHVLFLGADDDAFATRLRELARREGVADRTHLRPSVPTAQIHAHTRQADVGVSLLEDVCENHRLALPNKVFEYVAAGVPAVASDLPELRALVERWPIGRLARPGDPDDVARALRAALADRGERIPPPGLSWPVESAKLSALYRGLAAQGDRPRALVLVRNTVAHDARVIREAKLLVDLGYETRIVGASGTHDRAGEDTIDGIAVRRLHAHLPMLPPRGLSANADRRPHRPSSRTVPTGKPRTGSTSLRRGALRLYRALVSADWYRRGLAEVRRTRPALIHCNDYNTMWIGVAAKARYGAKLVYDLHELWPDRNLRPEWRPWLLACESLFVRVADRVIATSPGYAHVVAARYRIPEPQVIRNIPDLPRAVRSEAPSADSPLAVYFGALTRGRGLEDAIAALPELPDLRLRLVGPEAWGFRAALESLAVELGVEDRLEVLDPVPPGEALAVIGEAHVGLALIQPVCLSYRLTLPNKLFEYALTGVPILATDLPVMREFVARHALGVTVPPGDATALVDSLRTILDPQVNARLRAAVASAQPGLTWDRESARLREVYRDALGARR